MHLDYLLFDASDDGDGSCGFDAMACVAPERLPALLREVEAVLRWAWQEFGAAADESDTGGWDFDLRAMGENDEPVAIRFEPAQSCVAMGDVRGRTTVVLTVSGTNAFARAFTGEFAGGD